ncbi:Erc1 protein [Starmerella bacillaris]|uniref:Erc1 protein n=1 Tax=Starmerella bacillaris TaxID=1247836 RepID=A0AAV5RFR7_STABA|nr:Erc1 protein [Starmerella bacillaris]
MEDEDDIPTPYISTENNPIRHHGVSNVVGSLGRQGFHMPPSRRGENQARSLVFSDNLDNNSLYTSSTPRLNTDIDDEGEAAILEEGIFAPSEPQRELNERNALLALNSNAYGSTSRVSSASRVSRNPWTSTGDSLHTTVLFELKLLVVNSIPLAITFFLQYSLIMASFFNVGHLGKLELGAVSLGAMTSSITGIAFVQGMSTCLDTLCSQAYGAGRPDLVGLYFQKGVLLVLIGLFPILVLWYNASTVLRYIVADEPDSEKLLQLATKYLRVMIFAMPGYTLFECGKRFLQAQNIFHASTIILVICAPLNILLTYVLVWNKHIGMGFVGAPLAVAITDNLLAILFVLYVVFFDGKKCWNGFTWKVFRNWAPLVQLAIPGLIMIESEFLAYEVMTLAASYLGTTDLAAQTILSSITSLAYEIPFAVGCAASTRVATLIGSGMPSAARLAAGVASAVAVTIGALDATIIMIFRKSLTSFFSNDETVIAIASKYVYLCAFMHFFDATAAVLAGIIRGQGRQRIGGYINFSCYYIIGVPAGLLLCFKYGYGLPGIWIGFNSALIAVVIASLLALRASNWSHYVRVANSRDA